jgi:hypothetical protein
VNDRCRSGGESKLSPCANEAGVEGRFLRGLKDSQFVEPRKARNASESGAWASAAPRAQLCWYKARGNSTTVAGCRRPEVRPNPSLERTRNGMPPPRGRRYAVHSLRPRGGGIPLRSAQLKR